MHQHQIESSSIDVIIMSDNSCKDPRLSLYIVEYKFRKSDQTPDQTSRSVTNKIQQSQKRRHEEFFVTHNAYN